MNESINSGNKPSSGIRLKRVGASPAMPSGVVPKWDSSDAIPIDQHSRRSDGGAAGASGDAKGKRELAESKRGRNSGKVERGIAAIQGTANSPEGSDEEQPSTDSKTVRGGESKSKPNSNALEEAKRVFADIGERFNQNRKKSKASAYEQYQRDLMDNMDILVLGEVISLKDITATITDLEGFMRDNTSDQGKSQAQLLAEWLSVDPQEVLGSSGATQEDA